MNSKHHENDTKNNVMTTVITNQNKKQKEHTLHH